MIASLTNKLDRAGSVNLVKVDLHQRVLRLNLEIEWDAEHLFVSGIGKHLIFDLMGVLLASQDSLELKAFSQVLEVFAVFEDSLLFELFGDVSIDSRSYLNSLAKAFQHLSLHGVHESLDR